MTRPGTAVQVAAQFPERDLTSVFVPPVTGEYEEAIGVAGIGMRHMGDDRVRAARLLGIVVQAQLAITAADPGLTAHWPHRIETIANSIARNFRSGAKGTR